MTVLEGVGGSMTAAVDSSARCARSERHAVVVYCGSLRRESGGIRSLVKNNSRFLRSRWSVGMTVLERGWVLDYYGCGIIRSQPSVGTTRGCGLLRLAIT